jgi:propionyl-CoA carboxylase alpha chain
VSEMVTGIDLVELMLRVAAGERLPSSLTGSPVPILGHAFEARVYAEDPLRGFLPSTGRLASYVEPPAFGHRDPYVAGPEIRCDSGISQGSEISMFYDPMICKVGGGCRRWL